jgi:HPr kinase/phosphorylase
MTVAGITVEKFYEAWKEDLQLTPLTASLESRIPITVSDINRPGLAMAGFVENFLEERIQIIGRTEIAFLETLTDAEKEAAYQRLFQFTLPCILVAKDLAVPERFLAHAVRCQVPVLRTPMSTTPFIHELTSLLDEEFAPSITMHGSLVDVYGVGLLFTGRSSIGKSECALDLVERGHRLVADDVVLIKRRHENILIGRANQVLGHFMEIRGIGIIDVRSIFGIRAIRFQKRVEVEVHLKEWDESEDYERIGLDDTLTTILGVSIPQVTIPIFPGKNLTVISEVIALNYLVKAYGFDPAKALNQSVIDLMQRNTRLTRLARGDLE